MIPCLKPALLRVPSLMDNLRLVLFFSLALVLLLLYQAWIQDYGPIGTSAPPPKTAQQVQGTPEPETKASQVPAATIPEARAGNGAIPEIGAPPDSAPPILVETDLLRLEISPLGGTILSAWLKAYPVSPEDPETKVRLLKPEPPNLFIAESGLRGPDSGPLPADTRKLRFTSEQESYVLGENQDHLEVVLTWRSSTGLSLHKRYRFQRGSYVIDSVQEIQNNTGQSLAVRAYTQLQRTELRDPNATRFVYTYTGGVYYTPEEKYQKVSFKEMKEEPLSVPAKGGWIAMIQHYFLSAWLPPKTEAQTFFTSVLPGDRYLIGSYTEAKIVPAGGAQQFQDRLYIGPKLQDTLASIAPGLDLVVDYGWLTVIAQPIFWLLAHIHAWVGNWGWSIILLTILIKLAFYKLSETSYRSMANMRKLTPRLQALKDRYGDDKERLNQAMMEMYKKEKINPLGGCLPVLVQIPVFIALYWVLLESVELRQAPFALWIDNLSAPDPYFVLPLIMGISMFVQQKLNPAPPDPIQAKVMMSLPFVFTVFFAFFPSGLVLYWVVNNLLSIAQQWYITRKIEQGPTKPRGTGVHRSKD